MNSTWLLGYDFSPQAQAVLENVMEEINALKGHLYLLHVYSYPPSPTSFEVVGSEAVFSSAQEFFKALGEKAQSKLSDVKLDLNKRFPDVEVDVVVREGDAIEEIIAVATELAVDRVVVGTHGRKGVEKFLMGSVADRVVKLSPVSVLVVKTIEK